MTYSIDTTIRGESRGSPDSFYDWAASRGAARLPDVRLYLDTLYKLCTAHNVRYEVLVAQSIHETTDKGRPWNSYWWRARANPGGIGITGTPTQDNASRDFQNGENAARAHFLHAWLYAVGTSMPSGLSAQDDPRWQAAIDAGYAGVAPTLRGFTGRYGMDPRYAEKWVSRLNQLEPIIARAGDVTSPAEESEMSNERPYILVTAGHRSTGDPGNPTERDRTDELAVEYVSQLREAGYTADWWQRDLDRDSDPTMTLGNLDTVARGCARVLAARPERMSVLLDLHYNGPHSPVHVIVPDTVGLHTAYSGGAPSADTAANNTLDVRLAQQIGINIAESTGLRPFSGRLGVACVMSERETGVALQYGARLAMFAASAASRMKAVRLVIEHGGYDDAPTRQPGFEARCAAATVKALNAVFDVGSVTPPKEDPQPAPPDEPGGLVYPVGLDKEIAALLFGGVTGTDGREYAYNESGPVSQMWLDRGKQTGQYPDLLHVFTAGTAKYFQFSDGWIVFTPDEGKAPLQSFEDAAA